MRTSCISRVSTGNPENTGLDFPPALHSKPGKSTWRGEEIKPTKPNPPRQDLCAECAAAQPAQPAQPAMTVGRLYTTPNGITGRACRHPLHERGKVAYLETAAGEIVAVRPGTVRRATPNEAQSWKRESRALGRGVFRPSARLAPIGHMQNPQCWRGLALWALWAKTHLPQVAQGGFRHTLSL